MTTRKRFLEHAAIAAAVVSTLAKADLAAAAPAAKRGPSAVALALARWLQRTLPRARLSNSLTEKIAGDIDDGFAVNAAFRNKSNAHLPEPDFLFVASEDIPISPQPRSELR
ncbi:MAG: hypothetical protein DLM53_06265 [Candidatus Eremiobacter antarcticus]|nr:hypothetical protein [Candidatus Eremiobacteraeota bacterium]MBC5807111.1 hypothetical protein [Candidatus Eremiobacteraeota bacterium]PZR62417.1 MAG: hypothetical protein DLM53_06265 [Candidatus Eremiobacter sp. RRmetagenome_bin22]